MIHGIVLGNLVSKANSRQAVPRRTKTGKSFVGFIKSRSALDFEESALMQLKSVLRHQPTLTGSLQLRADVYYSSRRPDLDISLFMDILQKAGAYENDRQVDELILKKFIDPENPRVIFWVSQV